MTAPITMNSVIHGAVRRDLDRLAAALAELPVGDTARAADLARAYSYLCRELHHHHEGEEAYVLPWMAAQGLALDLLPVMESEHAAMSAAVDETDAALQELAADASAPRIAAARESVARTRAVVDTHLDHEERDVVPAIVPHMESPGWKGVEKKLRARPAADNGRFFAWITDGMADEHRTYIRSTVPAPVVFVFGRVLGRGYRREVAPVWGRAT
ncbi:hemerythrin domain-containing protein [Blastococcus sp. URHD0036]|uniref:hemerythrin domain-containing protein n=1 Tax=Blastococcus sp. URHD0036 TaxID=1380356 RepID=UPI0004966A78|nr:hemerythrin domain-containing protein [Blastococcus sp. URHD0036]